MEQVSRQVRRAQERQLDKEDRRLAKHALRTFAARKLLKRQTAREKSGFYEGTMPVAACLTPSRSRVTKRLVKKGQGYGRIIKEFVEDGREIAFHATKGWRSNRLA